MAKKRAFRMKPSTLIISLIIFGGLAFSLYKVVPRALNSISEVPQIDVISSLEYGPVELDGVVQKEATTGTYLLVTETFNYVELIVNGDIDAMLATRVHVTGVLGAPTIEGGKPILVVTTMESI